MSNHICCIFISGIGFLWRSLLVKLSFSTKDPPKNQYLLRITFLGGSLVLKLNFSTEDPPKTPIHDFSPN